MKDYIKCVQAVIMQEMFQNGQSCNITLGYRRTRCTDNATSTYLTGTVEIKVLLQMQIHITIGL